jgi:hypothetical protein
LSCCALLLLTCAAHRSVTTLTSVGFGDITPGNGREYAITTFVEVLGSLFAAYLFGAFSVVISSFNREDDEYQEKMQQVRDVCLNGKVPPPLVRKIFDFYKHQFKRRRDFANNNLIDDLPGAETKEETGGDKEMLQALEKQRTPYETRHNFMQTYTDTRVCVLTYAYARPPADPSQSESLHREVIGCIEEAVLKKTVLFSHAGPSGMPGGDDTLVNIALLLTTVFHVPDECLYVSDEADTILYFVKSGIVTAQDASGAHFLCEHREGEYFGDNHFASEVEEESDRRYSSVFTVNYCVFSVIGDIDALDMVRAVTTSPFRDHIRSTSSLHLYNIPIPPKSCTI